MREDDEMKSFQEELKEAMDIICKYGVLENMDNVCTYETFMTRVKDELSRNNNALLKSKKSTVFMGDIDNLGKLNMKYRDEKKVDLALNHLIKDLRKVLSDNQISHYDIGKMGDEIYIFVPDNITDDETLKMLKSLNDSKAYLDQNPFHNRSKDAINISFEASRVDEKGIEEAILNAEEKMMKVKENKKFNNAKAVLINEGEATILMQDLLNDIDVRLRIDQDKLNQEQYKIYKENKCKSIRKNFKQFDDMTNHGKNLENITDGGKNKQFNFLDNVTLRAETKRYKEKYPHIKILARELEVLHIADALQYSPIPGVQRKSRFLNKTFKELFSENTESELDKLKNTKVSTLEIGKVKYLNDNFGHSICDRQIYNLMQAVTDKLDQLGIQKSADIIEDNISTYYILINSDTPKEKWDEFEKSLNELEKKQILSITASKPRKLVDDDLKVDENLSNSQKEQYIKTKIVNDFKETIRENSEENSATRLDKKVRDNDLIDYAVSKSMKMMWITYGCVKKENEDIIKRYKDDSQIYDGKSNKTLIDNNNELIKDTSNTVENNELIKDNSNTEGNNKLIDNKEKNNEDKDR